MSRCVKLNAWTAYVWLVFVIIQHKLRYNNCYIIYEYVASNARNILNEISFEYIKYTYLYSTYDTIQLYVYMYVYIQCMLKEQTKFIYWIIYLPTVLSVCKYTNITCKMWSEFIFKTISTQLVLILRHLKEEAFTEYNIKLYFVSWNYYYNYFDKYNYGRILHSFFLHCKHYFKIIIITEVNLNLSFHFRYVLH